jgi:NADPH-dependent 2,4-dienoyl-CoA reductase/sulfur reductase-like enzyme
LKQVEMAVVGAGPAGMAAAIEAARTGVQVWILDENRRPGGQIYRQLETGFDVADPGALGRDYERGLKLLREFDSVSHGVQRVPNGLVWGIFPENELAFLQAEQSRSLRYRKLIIAAGAFDRPVPFPGWTLPGVFTAGGAQRLVKIQRVLPGENILLAGTGPLQLALANQIADAGGRVAAILEAGRVDSWVRALQSAWGQWQLISDALKYLLGIRKARIPLWRNHIIVEARGDGQVEEAVIAEVDRQWRPKPGTERVLKVDAVCIGYGFVPSTELTRLAQCKHQYDPLLGGWLPIRDENMQTTVPGVYATGDCSGVAGSLVALEEGRIAGIAAARSLGYLSDEHARARMASCRKRLAGLGRLRRVLDDISMPRPGLYGLAREDTIVCRCEELTLAEIKEALDQGATDLNEVKRMTRMGMGPCQGRMCGPAVLEIVARQKGVSPQDVGYLNPRPPVKPVPLTALAEHRELE